MTTISQNQSTVGILHPKTRNQFRVKFIPSFKCEPPRDWDILTRQVIRTSNFSYENDINSLDLNIEKSISITFEDDRANMLNIALSELMNEEFTMYVECLDGNESVLERYIFSNATISGFTLEQGFDYSGGGYSNNNELRIGNKSPEFNSIIDNLSDEAQAIYHALRQLNVTFNSNYKSHCVEKTITVLYNKLNYTYF